MKTSKIKPPFKTEGEKYQLCEWIIQHFPENYKEMVYVEPFCGAASTLINKIPSVEEAINDIDCGIIKIMRAIRDECDDFVSNLQHIECSKETFNSALQNNVCNNEVVNEFVLRRMSKGGLKKIFAWSDKPKICQNKWKAILDSLSKIAQRLEQVYIFNKPAIEVLNAFNKTNTLVFADPPEPITETEYDHTKLADLLKAYKGKVIVSNNSASLYNRLYKSWNNAKKKCIKTSKTTCLWFNY